MKKICEYCNLEFEADRRSRKFCSVKCRTRSTIKTKPIPCCNCGKIINKTENKLKRSKENFCSIRCKGDFQKKSLRGRNNPNYKDKNMVIECSYCNKKFSILICNTKNSDGSVKKNIYCSKECKSNNQKDILKGKNNPNYNFNKTEEDRKKDRQFTEYAEWRVKVFEKCGYKCIRCGTNTTRENRLVAHHILNYSKYPELRTDVNNGVALCSKCHWSFHKIYGTINNNQNQLNEFINYKKGMS